MLPTLPGRIQTRIFLLAVVGGIVTLLVVPLLPGGGSLGEKYKVGFIVLAAVAVIGVAWECLYHLLMQWRWEKDWPTLFGFFTFVNEGVLIFLLVRAKALPGIDKPVNAAAFWIQFMLVWIVVWLVANGPMRVATVHWRFRGGRLV